MEQSGIELRTVEATKYQFKYLPRDFVFWGFLVYNINEIANR